MRFFIAGSFLFIVFAVLVTAEEWSWSKDKTKDQVKPVADADSATNRESKSIDSYSVANDDSGSEEGGASLSDNATDTQPRHLIRDRLCGLGLMEVNKSSLCIHLNTLI